MPQSGQVTAGVSSVLASQYNNLRDDVLNVTLGHRHTGASEDGRQVPTGGLADQAVSLVKMIYGGMVIQSHQTPASDWFDTDTVSRAVSGTVRTEVGCTARTFSDGVGTWQGNTGTPQILFGTPFSQRPLVFLSIREGAAAQVDFWDYHLSYVGTTGFSYSLRRSQAAGIAVPRIGWMAIGPG